jgi:hypothetical protein
MLGNRRDPRFRVLIVVALVVGSIVLPTNALAQAGGGGKSCVSKVPLGLPADQRAVLRDAAARSDAESLPVGATVVDCNLSVASVAVPEGVTVTPSPVAATQGRASSRQSGQGQLQAIACGITGHVYYVSTPTYIHQDVSWSCSAYYASMSGAGVIQTPSSGSSTKTYRQTSRTWAGTAALEHSGIAWYGYHNRWGWEYGTFAFTGVGFCYVQTNNAYV